MALVENFQFSIEEGTEKLFIICQGNIYANWYIIVNQFKCHTRIRFLLCAISNIFYNTKKSVTIEKAIVTSQK